MEKLGIEPSLLLAQLVNFSIIVIVLTKLLYKPILTMLEKRKREIEEGLAITARMRLEEEKFAQRKEKLIAQARAEARIIMEDAKSRAKEAERETLHQAQKDGQELIEKAKRESLAIHESRARDREKEAVVIGAAIAKRLLADVLSPADQHKLIEKHLKTIEGVRVT